MDTEQKYKIKLDAAKILVKIYELALKRSREDDVDRQNKFSDTILALKKRRDNILKRIRD